MIFPFLFLVVFGFFSLNLCKEFFIEKLGYEENDSAKNKQDDKRPPVTTERFYTGILRPELEIYHRYVSTAVYGGCFKGVLVSLGILIFNGKYIYGRRGSNLFLGRPTRPDSTIRWVVSIFVSIIFPVVVVPKSSNIIAEDNAYRLPMKSRILIVKTM